jgi:hypothetical protein
VYVDLEVGDQDDDLQKVELELWNVDKSPDQEVDSETLDGANGVSGGNYTANDVSLDAKKDTNYEVRMTVYDQQGNTTSDTIPEST